MSAADAQEMKMPYVRRGYAIPPAGAGAAPWGILALDDGPAPEPALPSQFYDLWHHSAAISPERALAVAVLLEAVMDLSRFRFSPRRRHQRLYLEAHEWVCDDDRSWPYSFVNLCEALEISPERLRWQLCEAHRPKVGEITAAA